MRKMAFIELFISVLLISSCDILRIPEINSIPDHLLLTNNSLELIWNRNDIHVIIDNHRPMMISAPGLIIVEGIMANNIFPAIFALDSNTGKLIWKIPGVIGGDNIIVQDNVLYRAVIGNAEVIAYDLKNGKQLWSKLLLGGHSPMDLYSSDKKIFVYTNNDLFFVLNNSGEILDRVHSTSRIFLEIGETLFLQDGFIFKAINLPSNSELWNLEIDNVIFHAPIFEDGLIFFDTLINPRRIYSIDEATGQLKWESDEKTLSNLWVMGEKLLFISSEGYLTGLYKNSGDEIFKISFSPNFELRSNISEYYVTGDVTTDIVAISFGDNYQIMALKLAKP